LNKDAPVSRLVQRAGVIRSRAILGGLHHHYRSDLGSSVHTGVGTVVFRARGYTPDTALRESRGLVIWNLLLACELRLPNRKSIMAIASYEVVGSGGVWRVKHDGEPVGSYQTKESAFEAAVAAASLAVREGYEVQLSVPGTRIES
jgi:hypothetical protein